MRSRKEDTAELRACGLGLGFRALGVVGGGGVRVGLGFKVFCFFWEGGGRGGGGGCVLETLDFTRQVTCRHRHSRILRDILAVTIFLGA